MEPANQGNTGTVAITGALRPITKELDPGPLKAVNSKWFAFAAKSPRVGFLDWKTEVTS